MMGFGRGFSGSVSGTAGGLGMMGGAGLSAMAGVMQNIFNGNGSLVPIGGLMQNMRDIMDDIFPGGSVIPADRIAASIAGYMPMYSGIGFTVSGGHVTGMMQQFGSFMFNVGLPRNATFGTVGTDGIVNETLNLGNATTMMSYAPNVTGSGYHLMSEIMQFANPGISLGGNRIDGYKFDIDGTSVTGMHEVLGTTTKQYTVDLALLPTAKLSLSGTTVTETLVQGNTVEVRSFVPSGTSGLYALASDAKTFVQPGTATTLLSISPYDRGKFTIDTSNNHVTAIQAVRADGSAVTVTPNGNISFAVALDAKGNALPDFVVETIGSGAVSSYKVYHDGNGDFIYTNVAHGSGTIDLVGLQAQLNATIETLV